MGARAAARVAGLEVSAAALVDSSRGLGLTSVPGVDSSSGLAQKHECDMRNPLGVSVRVYSGSSRVRNGGAVIALRGVGAEVLGC